MAMKRAFFAFLLCLTVSTLWARWPIPVAGEASIVPGGRFNSTYPCGEKQSAYYRGKKISFTGNGLPRRWLVNASGNPEQTAGVLTVHPGEKNGPGYITLNFPYNKYNAVELVGDAPVAAAADKTLYGGFWARGTGTVRIRTVVPQEKGYQQLSGEYFLVTDQWQFYRTAPLKLKADARLAISAYGIVDVALPEIAPLPVVDAAAELVFYAPCDHGTPEPLFSTGSASFDGMPFYQSVPGISGNAIRIDRKRRLAPDGQLLYPLGFSYDFRGSPVDTRRGTVEFWFKPLPEMVEKQHWEGFPLFLLGDTTWQWANAQDFEAKITVRDGRILLMLDENVRVLDWPSGNRRKCQNAHGEFKIDDAKAFINQWHHIALTYDDNTRVLYLDGQPRISFPALKKPAVSSRIPKLYFAHGGHLPHPAVMSADLDEVRIYRGARYHGAFTPEKSPVLFKMAPAAASAAVAADNRPWGVGTPVLSTDHRQILFPLTRKGEKSYLAVTVADGEPLIFSGHNSLVGIRCDYPAAVKPLVFEAYKANQTAAACTLKNGDVALAVSMEKGRVTLELKKNKGPWRSFLEPRVAVIHGGIPWSHCYDGLTARPILRPFTPFACQGLLSALPAVCAWNGRQGTALMLSPESLCGYLSRGMAAPDEMGLSVRTVLDENDGLKLAFDLFPFDAAYGENAAIDRYHEMHPQYFRYDPGVNPKVYTNQIFFNVWNNAAYEKRKADFSFSEMARRTGCSWCWFYYNAPSPGNWGTDLELLSKLDYINLPRVGNDVFHQKFAQERTREHQELREMGIEPALYFYNWAELRYARYFSDSCMDVKDTYSGIDSWPQYWGRHAIDVPMMPSGTRYGQWLRRQMTEMMENDPLTDIFAYDLCGYWYTFRKPTTLGGLRAFDEQGVYAENVTAIALLLDEFRQKRCATGRRPAFVANADIGYTGFQSIARVDGCLHEQQSLLTLQFRQGRQRQTRLMGEKPTVYCLMPRLNGNFFGEEDPRLLRYGAVTMHHAHLLCGMLWNIRQNSEIDGVVESMAGLEELRRVQQLGYRQTTGAALPKTLLGARYGEIRRGALAAVNMGPFPRQEHIAFDAAFFNETPLMGIAGQKTAVKECGLMVPVSPLSWTVVDMMASFTGTRRLEYTSEIMRQPGRTSMEVTFTAGCSLKGLRVRLLENERCTLFFNGKKMAPAALGEAAAGDKLRLLFEDVRYGSSCDALSRLPAWEKDGGVVRIACDGTPSAQCAARRLAEFFRFTAHHHHWKASAKMVKPVEAADIAIRESNGAPQMSRGKGGVVIQGKGGQIEGLIEEYLRILDKKYPWTAPFGTQQPTRMLDYAATGEQERFQKRGGLINGQPASTQQCAEQFRQFLQEKKCDPAMGF